jgi:hypothetical protein
MSRNDVFISAVSRDLGTYRLLVELGEDEEAIEKRWNTIVQKVNQETLRALRIDTNS